MLELQFNTLLDISQIEQEVKEHDTGVGGRITVDKRTYSVLR